MFLCYSAFAFPFALWLDCGEVVRVIEAMQEKKEEWTTTKSARLEALEKKSHTNAQVQALEAAEETREKKRDTRRKILSGAYAW